MTSFFGGKWTMPHQILGDYKVGDVERRFYYQPSNQIVCNDVTYERNKWRDLQRCPQAGKARILSSFG